VPAADETSDNRGEIELRRFLFERAQNSFARWLKDLGTDVKVSLAGGPVPRVVRESVLREHAQLAVIGRGHTQGGLGRLQSCAYGIIRESPCPVVSI
jgi:nucleotide-binding universal stress UspA family protein